MDRTCFSTVPWHWMVGPWCCITTGARATRSGSWACWDSAVLGRVWLDGAWRCKTTGEKMVLLMYWTCGGFPVICTSKSKTVSGQAACLVRNHPRQPTLHVHIANPPATPFGEPHRFHSMTRTRSDFHRESAEDLKMGSCVRPLGSMRPEKNTVPPSSRMSILCWNSSSANWKNLLPSLRGVGRSVTPQGSIMWNASSLLDYFMPIHSKRTSCGSLTGNKMPVTMDRSFLTLFQIRS